MKYLITGIEGFVGGYLHKELLESGGEVYGTFFDDLKSKNAINDSSGIRWIDIRDYNALSSFISEAKPDIIFHLAAQSSVFLSWKNPQLTMDVNVTGTINILESIRNYSIESRLIMVGSSEEYGIIDPIENPINESHQLRPKNPYSISKKTCEELCTIYSSEYLLDIVMTRSFNHIGVGQSTQFVISDFTKRIAEIKIGKREPSFRVGNLTAKRDFIDVRDVVSAYCILAKKGISGDVYNVGSGQSESIQHYLNYMVKKENLKIKIVRDEKRLRPSDNPDIYCDNRKLKALGWKQNYNIYSTIDKIIDRWKLVL